jgi:hypothetical protein
MNSFLRWWKTLDRPERIVAMSLSAGALVAIVNSVTWAVAVSYMSHQKAKVAIAGYQADTLATDASAAATNSTYSSSAEPLPLGADAFDR